MGKGWLIYRFRALGESALSGYASIGSVRRQAFRGFFRGCEKLAHTNKGGENDEDREDADGQDFVGLFSPAVHDVLQIDGVFERRYEFEEGDHDARERPPS